MLASFSIFFITFARLGLSIEIHTVPAISFQIGDQSNSQLQSLGNWVTAGEAHLTNSKLSLVQGTDEDSFGKAFYNKMIHSQYFQIDMMLDLSDFKSMQSNQPARYKTFEPRRGFAFWYLTDPQAINRINQFGEYYGQMVITFCDNYCILEGLQRHWNILLQQKDGGNHNPCSRKQWIASLIGDTLSVKQRCQNFCLIRLPHKEKSQISIEFTPNELKVSAIVIGNRPRVCISNPNFSIKQPGFIGLSASNLGISPQDISLTKFQFSNNDSNFDHSQHLVSNVQPDKAILKTVIKKNDFSSTKQTVISQAKAKFLLPQGTVPVTDQVPPSQETVQSKQKAADQQAIDKALYQHQKQFSQIREQEKKSVQHRIRQQNQSKSEEMPNQKQYETSSKQFVDNQQYKTSTQLIQLQNNEKVQIQQKNLKQMNQKIIDQIRQLYQMQKGLIQQYEPTKTLLQKYNKWLQTSKTSTGYLRQGTQRKINKLTEIIKTTKQSQQFLKNILNQVQIAKDTQKRKAFKKQESQQIFGLSRFWVFALFILVIVSKSMNSNYFFRQLFGYSARVV